MIDSLKGLRQFMRLHVFSVWGNMSLVKRLQRDLLCMNTPWTPPKTEQAATIINQVKKANCLKIKQCPRSWDASQVIIFS